MRRLLRLAFVFLAVSLPAVAAAQKPKDDEAFVREKPAVGDSIPELTVYSPDGKEVKTTSWRGRYTVLTFGCLT